MAAAGIIANGVTEILKNLSSVVANEITLVWDFKDELKNLKSTLNMILDVMEDAEKKQQSQAAVRRWMEELKAIAYDAEDILDDYSYEVNLCKHQKSTVFNKVRNVFSSFIVIRKLAHQIKEINERFKIIANRKNDLGLLIVAVGSSSLSQHELMMMNREAYSFVAEDWRIVGRENDKSNIIKMLLEEENSSNNQGDGGKNVSVIPIMGMGGLGKTTMAQQVYNDTAVQKHFQLKIWICVSGPFDIKKLWKNIATYIGIDMVRTRSLQNALEGKKFLLVLDDVWNEKPADWNNFKKPFMVGREGSKILVTTRSEKVALIMVDKFQPYPLGILKENDCWSLFEEIAFGCAVGAVETPKLVEIGKEMVKRCGGLPLAVVFLGSLMRSKKTEEEWNFIKNTKLWHESREGKNSEILPSLRLSYDNLPSYLKLCFSYCSLFPKDLIIEREKLIRLWIAEGFLIKSEENVMSMEEIGNECFHSHMSNFFFQDVEKDDDGNIEKCKMHDFVHDLARSVVGKNEFLIVENAHDIDCISEETRRLNLLVDLNDEGMLPKVLKALKKAKNLRTILVGSQRTGIGFDIGNAFKKNKRLRVLDLSGIHATTKTYSSMGGFKHLRYLVVPGASFSMGGFKHLSFLQTLSEFNVDDKSVIEELKGLNLLSGDLSITGLENVRSEIDALRANLKEKKNLRGLNLSWYPIERNAENAEAVLEGLRPPPSLRTLEINDFKGSKLPKWIEDSCCLLNLVKLTLFKCNCEQVARFGALYFLRDLTLWNMDNLKCIGNEFYYSTADGTTTTTTIAFPSLKKLTLKFMLSLNEWVVPVPVPVPAVPVPPQVWWSTTATTTGATYCFPLLEEITIFDCPLLTTITPTTTTISPYLKILILSDIDGSVAETLVTNHLNSLTSLTLSNIHNPISLPHQGLMENNKTLQSLEIFCCSQFKGFFPPNNHNPISLPHQGGGGSLTDSSAAASSSSSSSSLESLTLFGCPAVSYYPDFRSLTSLRTLEIQECKESQSLLTYLSSSSSSLEHLEHVTILEKDAPVKSVVSEWSKSSSFKG